MTLRGNSIPTDGSLYILITDIGYSNEDTLMCRSGIPLSGDGKWYLHPTEMSIENDDEIMVFDSRGWNGTVDTDSEGHRLVRLRRDSDTAEEGVFSCNIRGDNNTPISVGIYYPCKPNFMYSYMSMGYMEINLEIYIALVEVQIQ